MYDKCFVVLQGNNMTNHYTRSLFKVTFISADVSVKIYFWFSSLNFSFKFLQSPDLTSYSNFFSLMLQAKMLLNYLFVVTLNVNLLLTRQQCHWTVNGLSNTGFGRSNESSTRGGWETKNNLSKNYSPCPSE